MNDYDVDSLQPYDGERCCGNDDHLTNEQKARRCCDMFNWLQYAVTFLTNMVKYFDNKKLMFISMYAYMFKSEIRLNKLKGELLNLEDVVIPTEPTYSMEETSNKMCKMSNTFAYFEMNKSSCCCTPWFEVLK